MGPTDLAAASSPDGRYFQFTAGTGPAHPGDVVTLRTSDGLTQLGQVDDVSFTDDGALNGVGRVLGSLSSGTFDGSRSVAFTDADLSEADAATIEILHASVHATMGIGTYLAADAVPARLLPHRFNRHTFWCGQSGSGKTYALGVVLEQLLIATSLPMVIFDPNADFVRLGELNDRGSAGEAGAVLATRDIRVLRPSSPNPQSLRVRFVDLPLRARAAVLRLHQQRDSAEYNELVHLEEALGALTQDNIVLHLRERATPAAVALAARIENLKVTDWDVWAGQSDSVTDIIDTRPDATVLDLGGFTYPDESLVVAMAVLDDLWAKREQRRPVLLVIDEAHNLCSPDQDSPLQVAVRERIIQIAAEGRKFGLWLLLSTQRPARVHPSIVSQCDNLALMKMTSPVDLAELATIFGFVPGAMLARSPGFRQGEALFAGGFVPMPTMVKVGARLTREGGADVRVPLR